MRFITLSTLLLPALGAFAEELKPFNNLHDLFSRSDNNVLGRRNVCSANGYSTCYTSCMPIGSDCCNTDGSFCLAGDRCYRDGCCPIGKTCSGSGGGTLDYSLSFSTTSYRNYYSSYTRPSYTSYTYDDGDDDEDTYTYSAPSTTRRSTAATTTTTRAAGSVGAVNADATSAAVTFPSVSSRGPASTSRPAVAGNAGHGCTVGAGQYLAAGALAVGAALL